MSLCTTNYRLLDEVRSARNPAASREFVEIYQPACFGYCLKRGMQPADAEDLTQQLWASLFAGGLNSYDPSRGRFRNWLFTCLSNARARFYGRHQFGDQGSGLTERKLQLEAQVDPYSDFDAICNFNAFEWAQRRVREEVSERDWQIFVRLEMHHEPAETLAADCELNPHTVREIRRRVRDRLLELFLLID